jgi:hypothetical protein
MAPEVSLSPLRYPLCGKYRKPDIRSMFSNPVPLSVRLTLSRIYDLTSEFVYFLGISLLLLLLLLLLFSLLLMLLQVRTILYIIKLIFLEVSSHFFISCTEHSYVLLLIFCTSCSPPPRLLRSKDSFKQLFMKDMNIVPFYRNEVRAFHSNRCMTVKIGFLYNVYEISSFSLGKCRVGASNQGTAAVSPYLIFICYDADS